MKTNNKVFPRTLLLVIFLTIVHISRAQEIKITYNFVSTEKLLQIFENKELTEEDFEELMNLHGTKAYLKKLAMFFPKINADTYKKSLKAALKGNYIDNDPYMFKRLVPLIPNVKKLLKQIIANKSELSQSTVFKLRAYTPQNININVSVYLTLGVIGGGWTFDDNPNSFYVDISSMKGDYVGLSYLCMHELYHLVQYRFIKQIDKSDTVDYLLDQMIREGSATYIADFSKIKASGSYIDFSKKEYSQNFNRLKMNFALFESLLFQAKHNESVNIESLYNIGYSGMYQSPVYYVGYHIIKLVEKYKGRQELIALLKQSPKKLLSVYIELYVNHENDDEFIEFSKSTIDIIKS